MKRASIFVCWNLAPFSGNSLCRVSFIRCCLEPNPHLFASIIHSKDFSNLQMRIHLLVPQEERTVTREAFCVTGWMLNWDYLLKFEQLYSIITVNISKISLLANM